MELSILKEIEKDVKIRANAYSDRMGSFYISGHWDLDALAERRGEKELTELSCNKKCVPSAVCCLLRGCR